MAASRVACASFNLGTNTTITITRDKKSYTHTLTYTFGSATGTIATKTTQTSIVWSPPASTLYAQMPNVTRRNGTVTCQTYDGNTLIGTTTAGFYASAVKEDCIPTITATIVDTNASTIAVTGDSSKLVCYISKPKVTMTATAKNSATITSRQIYNPVGLTATTSPYTFDTVYSKEFRCTATDSRGYSTTITKETGFIEYYPVYFSETPTIKRTESTSTTATLTIKGDCFKGSFGAVSNTLTLKYRYKTSTGSYGNYINVTPTWNTDGTFTASVNISNLSLTTQYTFEIIAQDKLTSFGDGETILLSQGMGDLRIGKDYIQTKNDLIIGDTTNTVWKGVRVKRKVSDANYSSLFGIGNVAGSPTASIELKNANNNNLGRYDLRNDSFLYNYLTNMSVAEMESYAPSTVASASLNGRLLLNGGNSDPILVQWGRVNITPTAANTITKIPISFIYTYQGIPLIKTQAVTSAPATIDVNPGDITTTGFNIYLQRTNTVSTSVVWFAIGNGTPSLPE